MQPNKEIENNLQRINKRISRIKFSEVKKKVYLKWSYLMEA